MPRVAIVAALGGGTARMAWTGGIIGMLAGVALASVNARLPKDEALLLTRSRDAKPGRRAPTSVDPPL